MLRLDVDPVSRQWQVLSLGAPANQQIAAGRDRDIQPTSTGLLGDGHVAVATRYEGSDKAQLRAFTRSGSAVSTLVTDPDHDIAALIHDPWSRTVIGATWEADVHRQKFFDPDLAAARATLETRFPHNYLRVGSWAKNRGQLVVHVEKTGNAGAVYLFEPSSDRLTLLGEKYPALNDPAATGQRLSTHYPARDGRRIPAILTLPDDGKAEPRPLVILLEGYPFNASRMLRAPWALQADMPNHYPRLRADPSFYWLPAYLASRGFAVVEPAIRGTRGFGGRLEDAGDGQWAHGGVDDVEDAAHALVKAGIVDATRICTLGLQEAGQVALLAAARPATPVTCSIAVNAPLDLPAHWDSLQRIAWKHDWYRREFEDRLGDDLRTSKSMPAVSPIHLAASIQGPVLIVGGNTTPWLSREQAQRMVKALDNTGKKVTFADLETGDHFLEEASTRTRFLVALDKFITGL